MIILSPPILYGGFKGQERQLINGQWANVRPRVSQFFGETLQDYTRYGLPSHNGVDLITIYDDPIIAMHDGVVIRDEPSPTGGNWVFIWNREKDFLTVYMHNKSLTVKKGDTVKAGQIIALSDSTGNSTGSHVHVGFYFTNDTGGIIDDNPWGGAIDFLNDPRIKLIDTQNMQLLQKLGKKEVWAIIDGRRYWIANPHSIDTVKYTVEEGDPYAYPYVSQVAFLNADEPV